MRLVGLLHCRVSHDDAQGGGLFLLHDVAARSLADA